MSPTYVGLRVERGGCERMLRVYEALHTLCVCVWEGLSGPDGVSLHDKQLLRAGMCAGQSGK